MLRVGRCSVRVPTHAAGVRYCPLIAILAVALWGNSLGAQTAAPRGADALDNLSQTRHTITLDSTKLAYEATAGTLVLRDDAGQPRAHAFFTAYRNTAFKDMATRPVTFFFNGGPGSSSACLHLGAFGPRRALLDVDGKPVAAPYRLVDNEATLLDVSDLVFIDPVSTGYSRVAAGVDAQQFHGVEEDVEATAAFIRRYVVRFGRQASPKFLAGESYGAARAALLAQHLQEKKTMAVSGILLISMVLNFQTIRFHEGNDLPYPLFLPSYAAAAWHHKKLGADVAGEFEDVLSEVEKFAETDYVAALMKGSRLPAEERQQLVKKLAGYTGLAEDYLDRNDLRVEAIRYRHDLLRAQQKVVGRFDSRFLGASAEAQTEGPFYDPSRLFIARPVGALVDSYFQKELKFTTALTYRVATDKVLPWNYGSAQYGYLNATPALRQAMLNDPHLRVFVAAGYFDLATPYVATRYTLDHLRLEAAQRDRITLQHYQGGHMMYIDAGCRAKLKKDVTEYLMGTAAVAREKK